MRGNRVVRGPNFYEVKKIAWGIVASSCAVVFISSAISNILPTGLFICVGILGLTWLVLSMKVSIGIHNEQLIVRCEPFYTARMQLSEVLGATTAGETTLAEGFGVRMLGNGSRGVLVGGPSVALETRSRKWVISSESPEAVAKAINSLITRG